MKTPTLLALTAAAALSLTAGCHTPLPRVTALRENSATTGSGDLAGKNTNLDTPPLNTDIKDVVAKDGSGSAPSLPEDGDLNSRDFDRKAFAADTVYFEYDHSDVKTREAAKVNLIMAELRTRGAGHDLLIEGHCDEKGTEEYNRSLGERRALALRELLMQAGVDGRHIFTRTYGKDQPAALGHDEAARSQNRRGEFVLVLPKKITTTQSQQ